MVIGIFFRFLDYLAPQRVDIDDYKTFLHHLMSEQADSEVSTHGSGARIRTDDLLSTSKAAWLQ